MEGRDETGSVRQRAQFPRFATEYSRLRTYDEWPKQMKQTPAQLADAGLYYTKRGDRVVCFSCGGGLHTWEEDDIPWEQHALYYGDKCEYVRLLKGNGYHEEVIAKLAAMRIIAEQDDNREEEAKKDHKNEKKEVLACSGSSKTDREGKDDNDDDEDESKKCKICFDKEYDCLFYPCGHIIACAKCASALSACPACQRAFQNIVKVYFL